MEVGRSGKHLENNQKYMVEFTLVIPSDLRMFKAFQSIIMVYTIEKTNIEKQTFFTVGGKD